MKSVDAVAGESIGLLSVEAVTEPVATWSPAGNPSIVAGDVTSPETVLPPGIPTEDPGIGIVDVPPGPVTDTETVKTTTMGFDVGLVRV